jgi:hypothetical protein
MYRHVPICLHEPTAPAWLVPPSEAPENTEPLRAEAPADIRQDLVDRVRSQIAAGTYETPEKWQVALARLLGEVQA